MGMTRKRFLQGAAGGTVVLLIQACGGGGGGGGSVPASSSATMGGGYDATTQPSAACGAKTISNNHGHALTIQTSDLASTMDKVYSIAGTAGHDHTITLTAAQLATVRGGGTVTVTSTVTNAPVFGSHSHDVTVTCV
jgi:hypothetical protein